MDNHDIVGCISGIVGCVTGITSLVISIKQAVFSKGKICIEQLDECTSYYFDASKCEKVSNWVDTTFPAVLSIQVTNSSSYPISITSAILKKKDIEVFQGNDFNHARIGVMPNSAEPLPKDYTGKADFLQSYDFVNLPLRIEPFDSVRIAFAFPYASKLIKHYGETIFSTLEIQTSRRNKIRIPVEIVEYFAHFT